MNGMKGYEVLKDCYRFEVLTGRSGKTRHMTVMASLNDGMLAVRTEQRRKDAIQTCLDLNITVPAIYVLESDKEYERGSIK